jgi:hypothetical protein
VTHSRGDHRIATLWQLAWRNQHLSCAVYREGDALRLTVESPTSVIVTEAFEMQPRALARAHALRDALMRRGWNAVP